MTNPYLSRAKSWRLELICPCCGNPFHVAVERAADGHLTLHALCPGCRRIASTRCSGNEPTRSSRAREDASATDTRAPPRTLREALTRGRTKEGTIDD